MLQNLLREKVTIRDLITIFETLADYGNQTKDALITLTEVILQWSAESVPSQREPPVNEQGRAVCELRSIHAGKNRFEQSGPAE